MARGVRPCLSPHPNRSPRLRRRRGASLTAPLPPPGGKEQYLTDVLGYHVGTIGMSEKRGTKETSHVEAISDGVIAMAITLLILEIKVPQPAEHRGEP